MMDILVIAAVALAAGVVGWAVAAQTELAPARAAGVGALTSLVVAGVMSAVLLAGGSDEPPTVEPTPDPTSSTVEPGQPPQQAEPTPEPTPDSPTPTPEPDPTETVRYPDFQLEQDSEPDPQLWADLQGTWNPPPGGEAHVTHPGDRLNNPDTAEYWLLRPWLDFHHEPYGTGEAHAKISNPDQVEAQVRRIARAVSQEGEGEGLDGYRDRVLETAPYMQVRDLRAPGRYFNESNPLSSALIVDNAYLIYSTDTEAVFASTVQVTHRWFSARPTDIDVTWMVTVAERDNEWLPVRATLVEIDGRAVLRPVPLVN